MRSKIKDKTKIEVKIEIDNIVKIRLHNKAKSTAANIFFTIAIPPTIVIMIFLIDCTIDPYADECVM
jgi:hypothetical protein